MAEGLKSGNSNDGPRLLDDSGDHVRVRTSYVRGVRLENRLRLTPFVSSNLTLSGILMSKLTTIVQAYKKKIEVQQVKTAALQSQAESQRLQAADMERPVK